MHLFTLLLLFLSCATFKVNSEEPHHITAYLAPPGATRLLLTFSHYGTHSFWNKDGRKLPTYNHFRQNSYLVYAEHSLSDRHAVTLQEGYTTVKEPLNGNSQGFDDLELGWKYLLNETIDSALSIFVIGIIPVGDHKSSLRYAQTGIQPSLLYSFDVNAWRYDLEFGYRYYHGFPSDQLRANIAVTNEINHSISIVASSKLAYGLFNGKSKHNQNNVVFHPNYRLLTAQLEIVFQILSQSSLSLGAYTHLWGQNIGAGGGCFCGSWIYF